ncbi:MAG: glycosyltransferase family 4 protein [Steroidobacteraceae bacterium]
MRIGVYLVGLDPAYAGGLTTYATGLVNGLLAANQGHDVIVFIRDDTGPLIESRLAAASRAIFQPIEVPRRKPLESLSALPGLESLHTRARNRRMERVAQRIEAQCDVVLFPLCFMATYALRIPSIVSFHDLQHELFPQFFTWTALRARRVLFGATFRHASLIQASSTAAKSEALRFYADRITPQRIIVIPEGVDYASFSREPAVDARETYHLPDEFLFYPAQLWHHKNHLRVLEALGALRGQHGLTIPLVLSGGEYEAATAVRRFVKEHRLQDQVFILGKVPYPALRSLYRQATYVLSASLHESNCLPVLEAAASGTPIIIAGIAPNRESAAVFQVRLFDPLDVWNIAATLKEAWLNKSRNADAVATNRAAAQRFDWTAVAGMFIEHAVRLCAGDR